MSKHNMDNRGRTRLVLLCGILAWAAFPFAARAQYSINWHKISAGGGSSAGGASQVRGTIGQHDVGGPMTGGPYSLTGGFWALSAIQTPGAPRLTITITSTNTAMVTWPSPSTGYNPQQNNDLTTTNWIAPSETVTDNGTIKYIIVNPPLGTRYYRLKK